MLGTGGISGDERQVDLGFLGRGKFDFGLFGRLFQTLNGHLVLGEVYALVFFEFLGDPVDQQLIDIVAAQMGVAVGRFHFDDIFADFQDRDVERSAAEIVDGDLLVLFLSIPYASAAAVGSLMIRLHVQPGNLARVFGGLSLGIVEISGNRDDRFGHLFAQIIFRRFFELLQDQGRNLGRENCLPPISTRASSFGPRLTL